ncbi:TPA: hypothetical protein ACH3X3_15245 [Trebouxia sp. C0006]
MDTKFLQHLPQHSTRMPWQSCVMATVLATMTTNPKWKEIVDNLLPGQTATTRPDLVACVFKGKLQSLLKDLKEGQIFGRAVARLYVIEFQKPGLPHAHILMSFAAEDNLHGPDDFGSVVSAQLPDKQTHPLLYALVCKHMLHKEHGRHHPDAPCMRDDKIRFDYPKPFAEESSSADDAYPQYARPNNGRKCDKTGLDNRRVVPHYPYLLLKYQCHIDVEVVASIAAIKYVYKYVFKGPDRIMGKLSA